MESMTVNSVVGLLPETKSQIDIFVSKVEQSALEGTESPLFLYKQAKNMESIAKALIGSKTIKEAALNEAEKYHKEELQNIHNSKIEICEIGTVWDYSECNHSEYVRVCNDLEKLKKEKAAIEKYLQTVENGKEFIDPLTFEIAKLQRATKTSTTGLKITLNK